MKEAISNLLKPTLLAAALCLASSPAQGQTSFSMALVADNDFAVFSGTSSGVNHLLYQNNFSWPDQISNLSAFTFNLAAGDTTFYVLGMGGGGQENISGQINSTDIAATVTYDPDTDNNIYVFNPLNVQMSSDLGAYLTSWGTESLNNGTVADGTYDALLADVQSAFGNLTWGSPDLNNSDDVIGLGGASLSGYGFHFDPSTAHLFAIDASALGITPTPVPEPSSLALLGGAGLLGLTLKRRQRFTNRS